MKVKSVKCFPFRVFLKHAPYLGTVGFSDSKYFMLIVVVVVIVVGWLVGRLVVVVKHMFPTSWLLCRSLSC